VIPAREADRFSAIARGSRNPDEKERQHAVLFSYFDDSSDSNRSEYFAVGGLIGGEGQWGRFYVPWAVATIELKDPFRATDCECGYGQFKNWDKPRRDALMDKLVSIVMGHKLHGYASVVPVPDYKAVFPQCDEYDPYYLAVRHTIINMAYLGSNTQGYITLDGTECWFENSDATSSKTLMIYNELKAYKSWKAGRGLKAIHFADKTLAPLQSADLVAREAFKHFSNLGVRQTRIPVDRMRNNLNFCTWDRATLEYLRDNGGPTDLDLLTSWGDWQARGRTQPPVFRAFWKDFAPRA
jgi:hypothetical protein